MFTKFLRCRIFCREQFGLATWFREREYIFPAFYLGVATPSIRAVSNVRYGVEEEDQERRRARQKEGGSEKEKHLTLCLAGCRTQLISMLRQQIPTHRTLINASESVLVTWSSVRFRPFPPLHFLSFSLSLTLLYNILHLAN